MSLCSEFFSRWIVRVDARSFSGAGEGSYYIACGWRSTQSPSRLSVFLMLLMFVVLLSVMKGLCDLIQVELGPLLCGC